MKQVTLVVFSAANGNLLLGQVVSQVHHIGAYLLQMKENKKVPTHVGILHLVKIIGPC
jgi:hypothetical protein